MRCRISSGSTDSSDPRTQRLVIYPGGVHSNASTGFRLWPPGLVDGCTQAAEQHSRSAIRCSPSLTKRPPAGRTGGFLGARAAHTAASVRMYDGAATCRRLQGHREPRSTSFWSVACPLSQSGHCAARGSHAHHRADQLADWPRSAVGFPIKCSNHELSYALLARARESFKLCSHFKSLPPVSDRELSADLTWRAHRRKPEFPGRGPETQSRCVQGERGVNPTPGRTLGGWQRTH